MIRTKGEAGTGNIVEAVRHMRSVNARNSPLATAGFRLNSCQKQNAWRSSIS